MELGCSVVSEKGFSVLTLPCPLGSERRALGWAESQLVGS